MYLYIGTIVLSRKCLGVSDLVLFRDHTLRSIN